MNNKMEKISTFSDAGLCSDEQHPANANSIGENLSRDGWKRTGRRFSFGSQSTSVKA